MNLSPLMIVLIIGLVVVFLILMVGLFMAIQQSSKLQDAERQLQAALAETFSAFQTFGSSVGTALGRLVSKIRDVFERFFGAITSGAASLLSYLTNALTTIIRGVESLAIGLFNALDKLFFQFEHVVTSLIEQIIAAITTVPVQVGLQIILSFVKLVTDGIHLIFCFVATGFEDIINTIEPIVTNIENLVTGLIDDFETFVTVTLPALFNTYVIIPLENFITTAIAFLNTNVLQPILSAINAVCGFVCDIANALSIPGCTC